MKHTTVLAVHRVITHGEADSHAERMRSEWEHHILDAERPLGSFDVVVASVSYVLQRLVNGDGTLLPAGFLFFFGGLSAINIGVSGVTPSIPLWQHCALGASLSVAGVLFILSPRVQRRSVLTTVFVVMAAAAALSANSLKIEATADLWLRGGWLGFAVGVSVCAVALWLKSASTWGVGVLGSSAAIAVISLSNAQWVSLLASPAHAFACAVAATIGIFGARSLLRLLRLSQAEPNTLGLIAQN